MSMDIEEQLSALMDGELGRDERAFLLRRLEHDAELRATWTRYHLMRDVMTNRRGSAPMDLSSRVMAALQDEDRAVQAKPVARHAWRPWAGIALAAGVAMMAVFAVSPRSGLDAPTDATLVDAAPAPRLALPANVPGPMVPSLNANAGDVQTVAAEQRRELNLVSSPMSAEQLMLLRHGQMAGGGWLVGGDQNFYAQPEAGAEAQLRPAAYQGQ